MELRMKGCPPIYCPRCSARLMNAGDREVKNGTRAMLIDKNNTGYEYIIRCHKCGSYIGIVNSYGKQIPSSHR